MREISVADPLPPDVHTLMAIQRALPRWSVTDLARAARSPALGRLTRHVTDCSRCRRQGMNGPLCPRALALMDDTDRAETRRRSPRPEIAKPASHRRPTMTGGSSIQVPQKSPEVPPVGGAPMTRYRAHKET